MPINKSNIIFIGNAGGICGYLSHGFNIIRKSSSLTATRVAEDPAFKGFRNSGNRMKEASPIAASLYNLLPKEQKLYALYRMLTGEALKMIKQGVDKELIMVGLKKQYIDPIIERRQIPENQSKKDQTYKKHSKGARNSSLPGMNLFKILPYTRGDKRRLRTRRALQYADAGAKPDDHTAVVYSNECASQKYLTGNDANQHVAINRKPEKLSEFSDFTYLGELKECKGLRMWLRPLI
jgi:hypothetical protein